MTFTLPQARPPSQPISTVTGKGWCATAAWAVRTLRMLASLGAASATETAWTGTSRGPRAASTDAPVASAPGRSRRPSLTTTMARGRSSGACARAVSAAPRSERFATGSRSDGGSSGEGAPSPKPIQLMRASLAASPRRVSARWAVSARLPSSPGSSMLRERSRRTTTFGPTRLPREAMVTGRSTASASRTTARMPLVAIPRARRLRLRRSSTRRSAMPTRAKARAAHAKPCGKSPESAHEPCVMGCRARGGA